MVTALGRGVDMNVKAIRAGRSGVAMHTGLLRDGDMIAIDIASRSINAEVTEEEFAARRKEEMARGADAFTPHSRKRVISKALKAYSRLVSSADKGAVRIVD